MGALRQDGLADETVGCNITLTLSFSAVQNEIHLSTAAVPNEIHLSTTAVPNEIHLSATAVPNEIQLSIVQFQELTNCE
jgi:hypothetical protein